MAAAKDSEINVLTGFVSCMVPDSVTMIPDAARINLDRKEQEDYDTRAITPQ